jgi:arylsulfatase A-like enzyme
MRYLPLLLLVGQSLLAQSDRPNVLFIAVDDLRPEINAFGATHVITPNLDSLAAAGVRFDRAYCNVPVCGASRSSILTGVRPTYHRFRRYYASPDVEAPDLTTLPAQLKQNGYRTVSIGKIYHTPTDDAADSWTDGTSLTFGGDRLPYPAHSGGGWMNYVGQSSKDTLAKTGNRALPWEHVDTTDGAYFDGRYAEIANGYLSEFARREKPFFLALGFVKPHLPFTAPKRYWDLYGRDDIELPDNMQLPEDAPPALQRFNWGELRNYHGIPREGPVSDSIARTLLHGYYASVSFVDAQIGKVLRRLRETGLDRNTLVILWGDHGYNLGEHGFWAKHITMETAMRTTLLMAGPGVEPKSTEAIVELVDLYPTILDYCGVPGPKHELAGESLVKVLEAEAPLSPGEGRGGEGYALSKYNNGVTLITPRYSFTEYHEADGTITARMLYDHESDPDENVNLANRKKYRKVVERLHGELHERLPKEYWTVDKVGYPGRG